MDKVKILNYINNNLKNSSEFKIVFDNIRKLCKFLEDIDPDDIPSLLDESEVLYNYLKVLIKLGTGRNKKTLIKEYSDNEVLNTLIDAYFAKENQSINAWLENVQGKLLTDREIEELSIKAKAGDVNARNTIIEANLGLIRSIAGVYSQKTTKLSFDELFQEGFFGLEKAVMKYDPSKSKFSTYAIWWIRQAITRYIYDNDRTVRIPVHMLEKINKMLRVRSKLIAELNREVTSEEIASAMGKEPEEIEFMLEISNRTTSLDQKIDDDSDASSLSDFIPDDTTSYFADDIIDKAHGSLAWDIAKKVLSKREYQVLCYRFGKFDGNVYTLEETANLMGGNNSVTRERIRQIEAKAIRKLSRPNIKNILDENNMEKVKNNPLTMEEPPKAKVAIDSRTLFERLPEFTEEEIITGLMELSEYQRGILYQKFGSNLREVNIVSNTNENYIKSILRKLSELLSDIKYNHGKSSIIDYFVGYSLVSIKYAITFLTSKERALIYQRFGKNLDEFNEVNNFCRVKLQTIIIPKMLEKLNKKVSPVVEKKLEIIFRDVSKDKIIKAINFLSNNEQRIIYERFGKNLDELNNINGGDIFELYANIFPRLKQILNDAYLMQDGYSILSHFEGYGEEDVINACNELLKKEKEALHERFGNDLKQLMIVNEETYNKIYNMIIPKIQKILNGEIKHNGRYFKPIMSYFEGHTKEEVLEAIGRLEEKHQIIIYKRYGTNLDISYNRLKKDLDESYELTTSEIRTLRNTIIPKIQKILNGEKIYAGNRFKPFMSYFEGYTKEEILAAIGKLDYECQDIIFRRYGRALDEQNEISKKEMDKIYSSIILSINKALKGEKTHIGRFKPLMSYFEEYTKEELLLAISNLEQSDQDLIYKRYGQDLEEQNTVSQEDLRYIRRIIIPKLEELICHKPVKSKNLFELLNKSKEEALRIIAIMLTKEEREDLYKYYGYDLEEPKEVPLDEDFRKYVEEKIIPKLNQDNNLELPPIGLRKTLEIADMLAQLNLLMGFKKEIIIVLSLRLGINQERTFTVKEVSDILGISEEEVNSITHIVLTKYQKIFNVVFDNIMQLLGNKKASDISTDLSNNPF